MSVRFLADADLDFAIVEGGRRREPSIDFKSADQANLEGLADPDVLELVRLTRTQIAGYAQYSAHSLHRQYLGGTQGKPLRMGGFNVHATGELLVSCTSARVRFLL